MLRHDQRDTEGDPGMTSDAKSELLTDEPDRAVMERVAQALEEQDVGEAPTIVLDTQRAGTPLLPRRGG